MKYFTLFIVLLLHGSVLSQVVNIENRRIYNDTTGLSGSIDGNFSAVQNANLLYTLGLRPKVQYKSHDKKHYYLLIGDFAYTRSSDEVFANSGMLHLRYAYRIKQSPWKWESYAQAQYNRLLNQRLRSLIGTGIRWKFYDKKGVRFFLGTSAFGEYEEIQPNNQFNTGIRWSNYLSWYIDPNDNFSFTGATYYQPLFSNFRDFRFMGQYALLFKLIKNLKFKVEFMIYHDSRPPTGVRNTIFNTTIGFSYGFG